MTETQRAAVPRRLWKPLLILLVVVGIVVALKATGVLDGFQSLLKAALSWIEGLGFWGPVVFCVLYILSTVFMLPGSVLTLGAGVTFGVVLGSIYTSIASTAGATLAFLIGRYLAREYVAKRIEGNRKFAAIDEAVGREGWKIVGLTRLSPIFPFNFLNYAYSLTQVSLRDYFFASWIGMMPGTVMWVYIGSLAGDVATIGTGSSDESGVYVRWAIRIVGFIATVAVTVLVTRLARRALSEKVPKCPLS